MSRLVDLLLAKSVRFGNFTLKSGKKSDLYVDVRKTALSSEGSLALAKAVINFIPPHIHHVGGVELGAVPIIGSVLATNQHSPLEGFIIRKAAKEHGTKSLIENCPPPGTHVAIIEDVTTSGGSLLAAIQNAEQAGLIVDLALTIVDRQEGASEALAGINFHALVTRADLVRP